MAASIAQRLREGRVRCEIVNLLPVEAAVLRRDRIVVVLALTLLNRVNVELLAVALGRHVDGWHGHE
jgi:hypothetical protein